MQEDVSRSVPEVIRHKVIVGSTSRVVIAETVALCCKEVVLEEFILSFCAIICIDGSMVHRIAIGMRPSLQHEWIQLR